MPEDFSTRSVENPVERVSNTIKKIRGTKTGKLKKRATLLHNNFQAR